MRKKIILSLIITLFFSITAYSQDSTKPPAVKIIKFDNKLFALSLASVNSIASIGDDGVLIVESNYVEYSKYLKDELKKLGGEKIKYVINTHWHFDHCGGNKLFGKEATIIAQSDVKKFLSRDEILLGDTQKAYPEYALPKITFETEYDMFFNGDSIRIISLPGGHSSGDAIVYFRKANVVHIGDIIFADMFPFIDIEHGGNVITLAENIQKIITMMPADIKIIPGHGRIYTIEELKEYKKMVIETTNIVKKEFEKGKIPDEMKKGEILKDWKDWGEAFSCNDWIDYVYNSLKKIQNQN